MYVANFYIGREYTPGEVLPENMPKELTDRLLKAGAIREIAPAVLPEKFDTPAGNIYDTAEEATADAAAEAAAEEIDEEAEPEEIDVMAGIVTDTKAPSKSKGTGKTGGRKAK